MMTRPRVVAVVSAIASSTATFLLLNRLNLAGTLPGAMVVPLVGTLVGHWSNECLDCAARVARRRLGKDEVTESQAPPVVAVTPGRSAAGRRALGQWLLAGFAMTALAVSLYSLTVPGPIQTVVVKERVVEKTVTVTTEPSDGGPVAVALVQTDGDARTQGAEAADVQAGAAQTTAAQVGDTPSVSTPTADPEPQDETSDPTASADESDADTGSGATTPTTETAADRQDPAEEAAPNADGSTPVDLTAPAGDSITVDHSVPTDSGDAPLSGS
ncbi:MAG: hypothetical protein JW990_01690 [Thermoleophilia bacterium]|nr:hypothetical protein [Thermoleophilia bacterium]